MKQRVNYIDRLKGLAILLVVIGHLYFFSFGKSNSICFEFIYSFHMPLFMFLSGFVALGKNGSFFVGGNKLFGRLRGVLLPMMFFGICYTMTLGWPDTISEFFSKMWRFLLAPAKNGYWYLMSLSVFYLSLQVFRLNKWNAKIIDILIALCVFVVFLLGWKYTAQTYDPFCLLNCGNYYLFFIAGAFSRKYGWIDKLKENNWTYTIALICFVIFFFLKMPVHALYSLSKHVIVPSCAVVVLLTIFVDRENENSFVERVLAYVGRNTLDIYVLHYFIVSNINLVLVDRWMENTGNVCLSAFITFVLAIPIVFVSIGIGGILHKSKYINKFVYGKLK